MHLTPALPSCPPTSLPLWPRNSRVGANSPSLWPTMFSVTYTGTNLLPLCTAKVCPTNSGRMVLARLQVLTTFFSFFGSGPRPCQEQCVLDERALLDAACHVLQSPSSRLRAGRERCASVGSLLPLPRLLALPACPTARPADGRRTTCLRRRPAGGPPGSSPRRGRSAAAQPAALAGLADRQQLVLGVAHLADRGQAPPVNPAASRWTCRRSVTYSPSLATTWQPDPAERAIWPPLPILSSMLCTMVPSGTSDSGTALPSRMSRARA